MIFEEYSNRRLALNAPKCSNREALNAYRDAQNSIINEFREALREEYLHNNANDTSEALVWNRAWEDGHSYGLMEVENHYEELAEILNSAWA